MARRVRGGRRKITLRSRSSAPPPGPVTIRKVARPITKQQGAELEVLLQRIPGMLDIPEYLAAITYEDAEWLIVELSFPRFKKLDGEWVVIGDSGWVRPGPVIVRKKDGTQTNIQIKRVSKPFDYMGRTMVHGFRA